MNKYHFKKMFAILTLTGSMVLVGCSGTKSQPKSSSNQKIEKELDDFNTKSSPTDLQHENNKQKNREQETLDSSKLDENNDIKNEPIKSKKDKEVKKKELISKIKKVGFNSTIKDVLKSIVINSKKYDTDIIDDISSACDEYGTKWEDLYLYNAIIDATRKQKLNHGRGRKNPLEDLKIFNNLDKQQKNLPKQLGLMVHGSTYGKYKLYEMIGSSFIFLVTDQKDNILLVANNDKVKKIEGKRLLDLSKLLNMYNINPQQKYTDEELYYNLTFKLSKKINDSINKDSKIMETKDIVVVNSNLTVKENIDNKYYFLQYQCPYLFDTKTDIYRDIFNPNANIEIGQDTDFSYIDCKQNISMFDPVCPGDKKAAFQSLSEFLTQKNISYQKYISYEELSRLNKKVNKKDKKVKVKNR